MTLDNLLLGIRKVITTNDKLSIDIDLTYLLFDDRETALANISESLGKIRERITKSIPNSTVNKYTIEGNENLCALLMPEQWDTVLRPNYPPLSMVKHSSPQKQ